MFTFLIFIAVLAILVLSHEFGHFIVARRNGIQVDEFGFGFPPRLVGIRRVTTDSGKRWQIIWNKRQLSDTMAHHKGTIYSINLIPLGGFVRIKGENPDEPGAHDSDSFYTKKPWQKMGVVAAGVMMNFLLAAVLLSVGYMIGMPDSGDSGNGVKSLQVMQAIPGKPAAVAGIKTGDKILQVDNVVSPTVEEFQTYVNAHRDSAIAFKIDENGQTKVVKIKPAALEGTNRSGIGVEIISVSFIRYPWYRAIYEGVVSAGKYLVLIFVGLWTLITQLFHGSVMEGAVAGPVGVAVLTGAAAQLGFAYLLQFMALLSLNLAALNILPIPALDGGRLAFIIWSAITRRPVTPRVEQIVHAVGFVLLMFLVILITAKDVGSYGGAISMWWNHLVHF